MTSNPKRARRGKYPVDAHADASHRYNGDGVPVITSLSLDDAVHPISLRGRKDDETDRLVILRLTEDEARKVAADIVSLLADRGGLRR